MSTYPNGLGKGLNDIFESSAEGESLDLPSGEFAARNCKAFNLALIGASLVSITVGALLLSLLSEEIGILFLVCGIIDLIVYVVSVKYTANKVQDIDTVSIIKCPNCGISLDSKTETCPKCKMMVKEMQK